MRSNRPYKLAICTQDYNEKTIEKMFNTMPIEVSPFVLKNIEHKRIHLFDTLFFVNPNLTKAQIKIFENCISNGITALILLAGDSASHASAIPLLNDLGLRIQTTVTSQSLKIQYSPDFPTKGKSGLQDTLRADKNTTFALFALDDHGPEDKKVLYYHRKFFRKHPAAVEINFGDGKIVIMNSVAISQDRAEIMADLMTHARENKPDFSATMVEDAVDKIPGIVNNAFDVYDQVPLDLVLKRAGIDDVLLSEMDIMERLEEFILAGQIQARINGNVLTRS
ncbi:MAG: hypothetical protein AAF902_02435 [Chloroflexota bacterium]